MPPFSGPLATAFLATGCLLLILSQAVTFASVTVEPITYHYLLADRRWLVVFGLLLLVAPFLPFNRAGRVFAWLACYPDRMIAILATAVLVFTLVGTFAVFGGYGLTRDEAMAEFDTAIFRTGSLIGTVPLAWRGYAQALEPTFVLHVEGAAGWVSTYLPGNALLRAFFALVGSETLAGPSLTALSLVALAGVARRLWPQRPDAALLAVVLMSSSPQLLVTSMTPYAMTAHLALNLVWLWLFLRDTRISHGAAIATGVLATGLHQLAFHPLFVAPFVVNMWLRRRWALAGTYTAAYAGIVLFWIAYWSILLRATGLTGEPAMAAGSFGGHVVELVARLRPDDAMLMVMNLVRFATWQNPVLLPLCTLALFGLWRWPDTIGALAAGIVLTVGLVSIVLPYQGHGWGYRYVHGLLGSFVLIATNAYVGLSREWSAESACRIRGMVAASAILAFAVLVPLRCLEARGFVAPYRAAEAAIRASHAELVFVDNSAMPYTRDLVRNAPALTNRPLVLDLTKLDQAQIRSLCATHDVAVFDADDGRRLKLPLPSGGKVGETAAGRALMRSVGCGHPLDHEQR